MRVLSLNPGLTELAFSIGAADLLVGRTDTCVFPEQATKIPTIGSMDDVSDVLVDVFEPTVILTGTGQKALADELGKKYRVVYFDPQSFADMFTGILSLGIMLEKHVEAEMLVHDLQLALDRLQKGAAKYKPVRTYVEVKHNHTNAASGYIKELVMLAGGVPFEGTFSVEEMQKFNPQFIISAVPSEDTFNFELLTARDGWEGLNAIKHERLFSIPGALLHHPGPRLVQGIDCMGKILHGVTVLH